MPLDHSIESRRAYDSKTKIYPPPDLQLPSYRKIARQSIGSLQRLLSSEKRRGPSSQPIPSDTRDECLPRRPLTPPSSNVPSERPNSPLFRLPRKLRQEIYALVLGCSNAHIVPRHGNQIMRHTRCICASCPGSASFTELQMKGYKRDWNCDTARYQYGGDRLSPQLLRTCRAIYAESIEFLYSSNIFSFRSHLIFQRFCNSLVPRRVDDVRVVHLDLPLETSEIFWKSTWDVLSKLPGLHELEIRLHVRHGNRKAYEEMKGLESLRLIAAGKTIQKTKVYVPEDVPGWKQHAPFEVCSLDDWEWLKKRRILDSWQIDVS